MADLPPLPASGADPLVPAYRQFGNALLALDGLPQATVAVVEGSTVGAGFGMACCSDAVILHHSARFGIPEPKVGFIPSQIIPFLVRRMGEGPVRDLAVTGRVIDAVEAHRLGVGRYLCATGDEVEATLRGLLDDILKMEPKALAVAKRLVMSCATKEDRVVMDEAAERLGMDPADLKLKNVVRAGDIAPSGHPIIGHGLEICLKHGIDVLDWKTLRGRDRTPDPKRPHIRKGWGIGCEMHGSSAYPGIREQGNATVKINED
eukprot:gene7001-8924_t